MFYLGGRKCRNAAICAGICIAWVGKRGDNVSAISPNRTLFCLCTESFSVILRTVSVDKILFVGLLQTLNGDGLKPRLPRRNQAVHT